MRQKQIALHKIYYQAYTKSPGIVSPAFFMSFCYILPKCIALSVEALLYSPRVTLPGVSRLPPTNPSFKRQCHLIQQCGAGTSFECKAQKIGLSCWDAPFKVECCQRQDKRRCLSCSVYFLAHNPYINEIDLPVSPDTYHPPIL